MELRPTAYLATPLIPENYSLFTLMLENWYVTMLTSSVSLTFN